jgi:diaminohydroxyphosphoribosylaminopyrimidine deaminase/5-amino-6-(5-phosphoribosylamino)uracil reductase
VIGAIDPNPKVKGSGIKKLRAAGIEVLQGLYEKKVQTQNEVFFKNMKDEMPFVCAKIAASLDGKLASSTSDSRWITGRSSRKTVQDLRREYGCVLTGINTVLADDPTLFPKEDPDGPMEKNLDSFLAKEGSSKFTRAILDTQIRIPPDSAVSRTAHRIRTIVFSGTGDKKVARASKYLNIEYSDSGVWDPGDILKILYDKYEITSVMLEAGPTVLTSFLNAGLIDKFKVFIAPRIIGGESSYDMFKDTGVKRIKDSLKIKFDSFTASGDDILVTAYSLKERG